MGRVTTSFGAHGSAVYHDADAGDAASAGDIVADCDTLLDGADGWINCALPSNRRLGRGFGVRYARELGPEC